MESKDINLLQLESIAIKLADLLPQVTFVGGSTTVLLVGEAAHFGIRKTDDVDVIIDVATLVEYHQFSQKLCELGFKEDASGPICRWNIATDTGKVTLDVMPVNEEILGFSNRWYNEAIENAIVSQLPNGINIRVVNPAYFLATKFEAFAGRGKGDYFSHDLEDIVFVLENREGLVIELMDCSTELKKYFSQQARQLLNDDFLNVLPGLLNNYDNTKAIENSLTIMKSWA